MNIDDLLFVMIIGGIGLSGVQFRIDYLCRHPREHSTTGRPPAVPGRADSYWVWRGSFLKTATARSSRATAR